MAPRVSVVMSVYNGERFLREAVESILEQTFTDFEFIIIDDGSGDGTWDILSEYADSDHRIVLMQNEENIGLAKSLNIGLQIAAGEYIARMDADDISESKRFETQVDFLDAHPSIGALGVNVYVIDEEGNIVEEMGRLSSNDDIMAHILSENQIVHSSLIMRNSVLKEIGCYDEELTFAQDYDLILRLSNVSKLGNLTDPLHRWRKNLSSGISVTRRQDQIAYRDKIRRDFLERHYTLDKRYIDLVLMNCINNPSDTILSEILNKIVKDIPSTRKHFIKTRIVLHNIKKRILSP